MNKKNNGLIVFFTGPMFSGKSERLLETINCLYTKSRNSITHNDIFAIKPTLDERDGNFIVSRNKELTPIQCIQDEKLNLDFLLKSNKDIIVIDEVQFFKNEQDDLQNILSTLQEANKIVLIAGLDRISNGKTWKLYDAIKSIEEQNKDNTVIIHGKAICDITGLEAEYSAKVAIGENVAKTDIQMQGDNKIEYYPVCKEFFNVQEIVEKEYNEYYKQGIKNHKEILTSLRKSYGTFDNYEQTKTNTLEKITNEGKKIVNNIVDLIIQRLKINELSNNSSDTVSSKEDLLIENNILKEEINKYEGGIIELKTLNRLDTQLSSSEQSTYLFSKNSEYSKTR